MRIFSKNNFQTKNILKEVSTEKNIELTDVFELYIIEIPKAKRILEKDTKNKLAQWMLFLNNPNEKEVSKIMNENKEIKEAMNELEEMSKDEELRRVAELREKAIRDEKNGLRHAREDGRKQGIKENQKLITQKLLNMNKSIDEIIEITGLPKEEIEKIKYNK